MYKSLAFRASVHLLSLGGKTMPKILRDTFSAAIDGNQGLSPPTLTVQGTIEVPTAEWKATLARKEPQGFNPADLLLEARLEKPYGALTGAAQNVAVRYEESPPKNDYTQVTVFEGQDSVTIEVKIIK
jgi:hypothetical protein